MGVSPLCLLYHSECDEPGTQKKRPLCYLIVYEVMLLWADIMFRNNSSNGTVKEHIFYLPPSSVPPADDGAHSICLYCLCPGLTLIITFVGNYYNKVFHVPTDIINPCKHNSYYICGKSRVMFQ